MTRITGTAHEDQYTFSIISRSILLKIKKKVFRTKVVEKLETRILGSVFFFFRKSFCRAGQATDDNMTHAHCMLDT
jgi:hypothetical protein